MKPQPTVLEKITSSKIVAILRGIPLENIHEFCTDLYMGGVRTFEIPLNSPHACSQISLLKERLPKDTVVGAGTVLTQQNAQEALLAGAEFLVSPHTDTCLTYDIIQAGHLHIPGCMSPSDIMAAKSAGASLLKVFPTTPELFARIREPFNEELLMPAGGLSLINIGWYKQNKPTCYGISTAFTQCPRAQLTQLAKQFLETIN